MSTDSLIITNNTNISSFKVKKKNENSKNITNYSRYKEDLKCVKAKTEKQDRSDSIKINSKLSYFENQHCNLNNLNENTKKEETNKSTNHSIFRNTKAEKKSLKLDMKKINNIINNYPTIVNSSLSTTNSKNILNV
jgi:hypothetical protein